MKILRDFNSFSKSTKEWPKKKTVEHSRRLKQKSPNFCAFERFFLEKIETKIS